MAIKTSADFIAEVRYIVDDPSQTRYSTPEYCAALTDSLRALIDRATIINPNFLQYGMGETKDVQRASMKETAGTVAVPADSGTAEAAVDNASTTLLDDDQEWVVDMWVGYTLTLTAGPGAGETFEITSNTPSILTVGGPWVVTPTAATTYDITVPANKMYDNALIVPWFSGQFKDSIIRITAGTGIGQQRKITDVQGYEMTLETDWTTALVNADTYEIVSVQDNYELPLDFYRLTKVKVNGVEIGRKQIGSPVAADVSPGYALYSNMTTQQIRIEDLGGGEMIEVFYIPEVDLLTTTTQIPMSDIFFRAMQYYVTMRLKGNNYEDLRTDTQFLQDADAAVANFMTTININKNMQSRSHYEEWSD